ncbi:hypothetical protein [Gordonia amicalis]|nr:hypothetical protein [Gordonia amicalis]
MTEARRISLRDTVFHTPLGRLLARMSATAGISCTAAIRGGVRSRR